MRFDRGCLFGEPQSLKLGPKRLRVQGIRLEDHAPDAARFPERCLSHGEDPRRRHLERSADETFGQDDRCLEQPLLVARGAVLVLCFERE